MTEEKIFKKRFPEYCADTICLSPYFDLFQIGFEEGEKQIEQLQEKNDRLIALLSAERERQEKTCESFRKQIKDLEKENAELKSIAQFQQSSNMDAHLQLKRSNERLTKAKEIITKLVEGIRIISDPKVCMADVDAFVSEAEQFLKEVSE